MLDTERLAHIASWLESPTQERGRVIGFDIGSVINHHSCGTVCCIAGAAVEFFDKKTADAYVNERAMSWLGVKARAVSILGLSWTQGTDLFAPFNILRQLYPGEDMTVLQEVFTLSKTVTPAWAARCIRNLIATGEVDWLATRYAKNETP